MYGLDPGEPAAWFATGVAEDPFEAVLALASWLAAGSVTLTLTEELPLPRKLDVACELPLLRKLDVACELPLLRRLETLLFCELPLPLIEEVPLEAAELLYDPEFESEVVCA
ncbi:hypothetical protein [Paraburkholderia oxyphila]|uniref:hypothetical protein n=1 Tax=Paraburkholderia oxyphila TaxID=614212 RepID=UPI00048936A4|nr:hypothetical protein [Paraburkholderia oxyphila]